MWMMHHAFGLFIFITILINFQVVLRYMGVFQEYSHTFVTVVGWSYSMTISMLFTFKISKN